MNKNLNNTTINQQENSHFSGILTHNEVAIVFNDIRIEKEILKSLLKKYTLIIEYYDACSRERKIIHTTYSGYALIKTAPSDMIFLKNIYTGEEDIVYIDDIRIIRVINFGGGL